MPSLYTHYLFYKDIDKNAETIALIGAQGPDPFFYFPYFIIPKKHQKDLNKIGTMLHDIDPSETFSYFNDYINKISDENEKITLSNYLKGLISHYALDSTCHPYIFYRSGFKIEGKNDPYSYFLSHTGLETIIDCLLMEHYKNNLNPNIVFKVNKKELKLVSKMYYHYLHDFKNIEYFKENYFYKVVKRMKFVQNFLFSKHGIKKWFFSTCLRKTPLNTMSHPKLKDIPNLDYLNLTKQEFSDCCDENKISNDSFLELIEKAKIRYENLISRLDNADELKNYINQIDHDGKKVDSKMLYFKMIWPSEFL